MIKDLNIRPETIKLLEENIGKTLSDIHHSRILYDSPPRILEIKASLSLTKEAKIYNGEKTISLTSGSVKIGQPLVKE